ncbi:MAG: hypothetical protein K8R31_04490 [Bacteroidales bacterium]|nr:hypothetical protein [Bacteroidales bacterium]MCD4833032.1 hypothetical protein [Bacteroidales bacterium]
MAMELEDLEVYQEANIIADEIWNIVLIWDYFQKPACRQGRDTIGKQIVKSFNRGLISDEKYSELKDKVYSLQKKLNGYIKFLRNNKPTGKQVN